MKSTLSSLRGWNLKKTIFTLLYLLTKFTYMNIKIITMYMCVVQNVPYSLESIFHFISFYSNSTRIFGKARVTDQSSSSGFQLQVMSISFTTFKRVNRRNDSIKICWTVSYYVKFVRYLWLLLLVVMFKLQKTWKITFLSSECNTKKTSENFSKSDSLTVPEDISGTPYIYGDRAG